MRMRLLLVSALTLGAVLAPAVDSAAQAQDSAVGNGNDGAIDFQFDIRSGPSGEDPPDVPLRPTFPVQQPSTGQFHIVVTDTVARPTIKTSARTAAGRSTGSSRTRATASASSPPEEGTSRAAPSGGFRCWLSQKLAARVPRALPLRWTAV